MIRKADVLLWYVDYPFYPYIGCSMECFYASRVLKKPTIMYSIVPHFRERSPFLFSFVTFYTERLEELLQILQVLFGVEPNTMGTSNPTTGEAVGNPITYSPHSGHTYSKEAGVHRGISMDLKCPICNTELEETEKVSRTGDTLLKCPKCNLYYRKYFILQEVEVK